MDTGLRERDISRLELCVGNSRGGQRPRRLHDQLLLFSLTENWIR
jgi:hypothetical protein